MVGFAYAQVGQDEEAGQFLRRAAEAAQGLHAPVLEIWATAFALEIGSRAGNVVAPVEAVAVRRRAERLGAVGAVRVLATVVRGVAAGLGRVTPASG